MYALHAFQRKLPTFFCGSYSIQQLDRKKKTEKRTIKEDSGDEKQDDSDYLNEIIFHEKQFLILITSPSPPLLFQIRYKCRYLTYKQLIENSGRQGHISKPRFSFCLNVHFFQFSLSLKEKISPVKSKFSLRTYLYNQAFIILPLSPHQELGGGTTGSTTKENE